MRNNYYVTKIKCDICPKEKDYIADFYLDEITVTEDFIKLTLPFRCIDESGVFQQNVPEHIEICKDCFDRLAADLLEKYNLTCVLNTGEKIIKRL